jgi:5-methyltetrahydropteroyltriglutamate--homocysteine methyltransferase
MSFDKTSSPASFHSQSLIKSANLGFPRMGARRELKKALEGYWKGAFSAINLKETAHTLKKRHWELQKQAGIDFIPSHDFTLYDHVLDTIALVGAIPSRYGYEGGEVSLDLYFSMARGNQKTVAMEMTKWFDTNYHYIVPELTAQTHFQLTRNTVLDAYNEAKEHGVETRPVLLGPVSFLLLAKVYDGSNRFDLLPSLLKVYSQILQQLKEAGVSYVQIDEPCLTLDLDAHAHKAYTQAYETLAGVGVSLLLTTYFGALEENLNTVCTLPVQGLHIDLVRAPEQLDKVCQAWPQDRILSLGVVDGRNIWKNNFEETQALIEKAIALRHSRDYLIIAPSCSLLHVPVDLAYETKLEAHVKGWMAFAAQKLEEIHVLTAANNGQKDESLFAENKGHHTERLKSPFIHDQETKKRMNGLTADMSVRKMSFKQRIALQQASLKLPLLPTTTIGSFPQTQDVREARSSLRKGTLSQQAYDRFIEQKIIEAMKWQDDLDLDVPVHGEFERNDMVEYFGEQLKGFVFTENGWVQSYGSRCVKPPVILGDVSRPNPMTVRWSAFAAQHTKKPVKGMLTGPVTILQWSFVRNDQPRSVTCQQIALAIRDEVCDLEKAGIHIIQIDEPALREGLPLRKKDWSAYLNWATHAFRLSASGVQNTTQIHTHMCYSEFNDIISAIADLDADVISIETSRSAMELLGAFVDFKYPNDIGPGVYDIHSPRIPTQQEMEYLLEKALKVLSPEQIWVNPDCGLKTRDWAQVEPALKAMVQSAKVWREKLALTHNRYSA